MRSCKKKSEVFWNQQWKEGLEKGVCPIAGCSLKKATCRHLDSHLNYSPGSMGPGLSVVYTEGIDKLESEGDGVSPRAEGAWELYKKLKKTGLPKDQVQIMLDRFVLDRTLQQIQADRGWTSFGTLRRRYMAALSFLKAVGFKRGECN